MGSKGQNFYNDLVRRDGYEEEAATIQELFLGGKPLDAAAAVPDALVDDVALVGPGAHVADQLQAWEESPVGTLNLSHANQDEMRALAELVL